ncbi:MAG: DUF4230 domain-containing protein [Oscillatoriales cyanobacterium RM2_1_1]|nr:DUF4230 domain-containing protein [Oscillatoriales cyanobacterium SM2_3_0]NJO46798.1 DUF4230 domain-containing protein [Oscillatoriales cyanobacterium RM2_1_1]
MNTSDHKSNNKFENKFDLKSDHPLKTILVVGVVCSGLFVGLQVVLEKIQNLSLFTSNQTTEVSVVYAALKEVGELTTVKQPTVEIVNKAQDRKFLGKVPVGDTRVVYYAAGEIQAGFDLNQAVVKESSQTKVEVLLPPPRISNAFIDVARSKSLFYEKRWLGPDTGLKLQQEAQQQALSQMVQNACATNILEVANERAEVTLETFLKQSGFEDVVVKTQQPSGASCSGVNYNSSSLPTS